MPTIPKIETNGTSLFIRNAFMQNGRYYDVKIERWDDQGNEIHFSNRDQFSFATIEKIRQSAGAIFSRVQDPASGSFYYSDASMPARCDFIDNSNSGRDAYFIQDPVRSEAERIHNLLFHARTFNGPLNSEDHSILSPTWMRSSRQNRNVSSFEPSGDRASTGFSQQPGLALPAQNGSGSTSQGASLNTSGAASPNGSTNVTIPIRPGVQRSGPRAQIQWDPNALFRSLDECRREEEILKDVTYSALHGHSNEGGGNSKVQKAYDVFKRVKENPENSTDPNTEIMKNWLKDLCRKAYQVLHDLTRDAETDAELIRDAARVVVDNIAAPGRSNQLVDYLINNRS